MRKFLVWVILLVIGFLLGFVPQYLKAHSLNEQVTRCQADLQLAQVRQFGALTYVAATQLNYGNASSYAQQFFAQAQKVAASPGDPAAQSLANEVLSARDKITADLAKGDSAVVGELQPIILKLEQAKP